MSLVLQLKEAVAAARGRGRELSGYLAALMPLAEAGGEESRQALANAKVTLTCLFADLNWIDSVDAAARMTGMIPQPVKAKELELHPVNHDHRLVAAATKPERWTHEEIVAARACAGDREEEDVLALAGAAANHRLAAADAERSQG